MTVFSGPLGQIERVMGLEPTISCLGSKRSTTELHPHGAFNYTKILELAPRDLRRTFDERRASSVGWPLAASAAGLFSLEAECKHAEPGLDLEFCLATYHFIKLGRIALQNRRDRFLVLWRHGAA
jgi:hypothetical protein